jgi:6-phosphofructokinase 1
VAVSEGAMSDENHKLLATLQSNLDSAKNNKEKENKENLQLELDTFNKNMAQSTLVLSQKLEELTGLESRVTILGHLQRGGTPSAADRLLATRLGTAATQLILQEKHGVMVAARGETFEAVPLAEIVGIRRTVPSDHAWVKSARAVGTCLGD